jgi:hypothetical protein
MPHRVTCPGCGRTLSVPDDVKTGQLSCPRCLAKFDNPAVAPVDRPAPSPPLPASQPGGTCPRCGKHVEPYWRFCPNCEAVLRGPRRSAVGKVVDEDVHRDTRGTSVFLILLAVLGGLGLIFYVFAGVASLKDGGGSALLAIALGILFLGMITTGIMFWRTRDNPSQRGLGRVLIGTLAMTGGLIVVSCIAGVAVFAFFFIACLAAGGKFGG